MRTTVLPLPTGRFIVVQSDKIDMPVMIGGAPVAYLGAGLSHVNVQLGDTYGWRGREMNATTFGSYRGAQAVVSALAAGLIAFDDYSVN